jgi:phosphoribosylaminoimidazole-succinocarboxamide synthase
MAAFWFEQTRAIAKNHLISVPDPSVSIVKECKTLPVEFVMRGYLTGTTSTSIWTAYARGERRYCGHDLPEGLRRHEKLPAPLLTPTTKALHGEHDELTSRAELLARGTLSEGLFDAAHALVQRLFAEGTRHAAKQGLILVDTKYELGLDDAGELVVIDEIHTPDSSRYWRIESYERALSEGGSPAAIDKEYVRLWLAEQGYRGEGAAARAPGRGPGRGGDALHRCLRAGHGPGLRARPRGAGRPDPAQSGPRLKRRVSPAGRRCSRASCST